MIKNFTINYSKSFLLKGRLRPFLTLCFTFGRFKVTFPEKTSVYVRYTVSNVYGIHLLQLTNETVFFERLNFCRVENSQIIQSESVLVLGN